MEKFVDVRSIIAGKNPQLLKWLPGFLIRWVEKGIHQDEINKTLYEHRNSDEYTFCEGVLNTFNLRFELKGLENIPPQPEKVIFAANHPLGGMDAISIVHLLKDVRPDIKFIVND
mgnify:CR=1 FL=1